MAKGEKTDIAPAAAPEPPAVPSGAWVDGQRGDVYIDGAGKEHKVVGRVTEGFDCMCDGQPENYRLHSNAVIQVEENGQKVNRDVAVPVSDAVVRAVNAWRKK